MLVYTALNAFNSAMSGATSGALIGLFGALLSLAFGAECPNKKPARDASDGGKGLAAAERGKTWVAR